MHFRGLALCSVGQGSFHRWKTGIGGSASTEPWEPYASGEPVL